tara:strand:+ start:113 stop:637 length:525 start_codon:yes stop_codon:yes gene_type:complete
MSIISISQTSPVAYTTFVRAHLAEIEKLKAENEKLKEENEKLMDEASGEGGDDLVYENEKLKAENDELKKGQIKLDRELTDMIWDPLMANGFIMKYPLAPIVEHLKILVDEYKKLKEYEKASDFVSIISDEATGVYHFLGKEACEETANKLISTGYMEREEFQCFNPNWEDHHG